MKRKYCAFAILLLGILLSTMVLTTPVPNMESDSSFNTKYALEYIAEISEEEHSVYDVYGHLSVKQYLKGKLEEFIGAENVTEMTYFSDEFDTEEPLPYDVTNLLGVIPGKSETGILIVAHYDSRHQIGRSGELGNSYGAADDGYGIATLLEIARLYGDKELENTIYILMTDAEETGLYGAAKAAEEPFMDNVGFVINMEARGVKGAAYMFETSTNNDKVIDFYKNADMPVSYSLATAVYTVMPNSTDFTEFLAEGKNGVNFAVLDGLYYYHTPLDNFTNVNPSSIAHYGAQIIPLVEEFSMNSEYSDVDYFDAEKDQIFFNVFSGVFVSYGETAGTVFHMLLFILVIGAFVLMFLQKKVSLKKLGVSVGLIVALIIGVVLLGYVVGSIVASISRVPFNVTYVRTKIGGLPSLLTLVLVAGGLTYLYLQYTTKEGIRTSLLLVGVFINALLALVTGFALSGSSFLFLIPGVSAVILLALQTWCTKPYVKRVILSVVLIINLLVILPLLYSLYLALTVGGLLALSVILLFYLFALTPIFIELYE